MAGDALRRASPANANQQSNAGHPLLQRATYAKQLLQETERHIQELNSTRPGMSDQVYHTKLTQLTNELRQRREVVQKFGQMWAAYLQGVNVKPGLMNAANNGSQTPAWMTQAGLQSTAPGNMPPDMRSPQQHAMQAGPLTQPHAPPTDPAAALRSIAPQQPPAPTFNNGGRLSAQAQHLYQQQQQQNGHNPGQHNAPGAHEGPAMPFAAPLDQNKFEQTFKSFCASQKMQIDERILSIDNRRVDLYLLHALVLRDGGFKSVSQRDQWAVIGGAMGWVNFPASATEPPKAGPGVANMIENAYKTYLLDFETAYVNSQQVLKTRMQNSIVESFNRSSPEQQNVLLNYSRKSVEELRLTGLPDRMISLIDQNRAFLHQRAAERAAVFANANQAAHSPNALPPTAQHPQSPALPHQATPEMIQRHQMATAAQQQARQQQQQAQQHAQQQQQQQHVPNPVLRTLINMANAVGIPQPQLGQAFKWCQDRKHEFLSRVATMSSVDIAPERRTEYNDLFAMLYRLVADLDDKLPLFFVMTKDTERVRRLLGITTTIGQQQLILNQAQAQPQNPVRYLISAESVKEMLPQVQHALEHFSTVYQQFRGKVSQGQTFQQPGMSPRMPPPGNQSISSGLPHRASMPSHPLPPQIPQQQPTYQTAPDIPQSHQQPLNLQPPPPGIMRKPSATSPAATSEMQASTPASAPTPSQIAPSPSAQPISPKAKKAKPVPKPKKPTKAPTPAAAPTPSSDSFQASSSNASISLNASGKRAREEDAVQPTKMEQTNSPLPTIADDQGPAAKRIKSEWEGPPDAVLVKKEEAVGNVKTEEDATMFFEQMSELFKTVSDGTDSPIQNLTETLDMILKGYSTLPDTAEASSSSGGVEASGSGDASLNAAAMASADDYFDFSSFLNGDEEELNPSTSKAPTPDLVASSSTNPSPESESDPTNHSPPQPHAYSHSQSHPHYSFSDTHHEDHDPLALGTFKEIDGGVSSFYQATDWKWEGSMQPLDWAILPSLPGGS